MESSAMQESAIMIDDSSEAFAERLELCVLRSASFDTGRKEMPGGDFFALCFRILESRRNGSGEQDAETEEGSYPVQPYVMFPDKAHGTEEDSRELNALCHFWTEELKGLLPVGKGCRIEDLVIAWETTLQMLFEAESAVAEERPVNEKEIKDILYSYSYDYAEEFLSRNEACRKNKMNTPVRFVTELVYAAYSGNRKELSPHVCDGVRLFFGDRLKARLLDAAGKAGFTEKSDMKREDMRMTGIPEVSGLGAHQKKSLAEFFTKTALVMLLAVLMFSLSACGTEEEEIQTEAQTEAADTYPGTVSYQNDEGTVNDCFGVMHATVLDVQKGEKDGLYVFTLRDEQDPENAWCLYSQDIGSIVAEMSGGKKVALLFSGDIVNKPDEVEFIAVLDDAPYTIKKTNGSTTANMMNSFTIRTSKGEQMTFVKDNCKVDRDALSTDNSTKVVIFYADCGGDKYPVRVYKASDERH